MTISLPPNHPFRTIDQLQPLDVSFVKLYTETQTLHESVTSLWIQYTANKSPDVLKQIDVATKSLKNKINDLKNQLDDYKNSADPRISQLANSILGTEAVYLNDVAIASTLQKIEYEKAQPTKQTLKTYPAPNPIPPKSPKPQLNLDDSEKAQLNSAFKQEVSQDHNITKTIGDGKCGLRAIAKAINPNIDRKTEDSVVHLIRGDIVQHMRNNPIIHDDLNGEINFENSCRANPSNPSQNISYDEYLNEMAKPGTFLSYPELIAYSHLAKRPVWVYTFQGTEHANSKLIPQQHYRFGDQYASASNPPIKLGHWNDHFDLLVDK